MNYKFNLGNVSINIPTEATVEIKDISVEVTDFNLKDIPLIIKETHKAFKDIKDMIDADNAVPAPQEKFVAKGEDTDGDLAEMQQDSDEDCDCDFLETLAHLSLLEEVHAHLQAVHPDAQVIPTPFGFAIVERVANNSGKTE